MKKEFIAVYNFIATRLGYATLSDDAKEAPVTQEFLEKAKAAMEAGDKATSDLKAAQEAHALTEDKLKDANTLLTSIKAKLVKTESDLETANADLGKLKGGNEDPNADDDEIGGGENNKEPWMLTDFEARLNKESKLPELPYKKNTLK